MNENGTRTDNLNGPTCFKLVPVSGVRFGSVIGATSYRYRIAQVVPCVLVSFHLLFILYIFVFLLKNISLVISETH